MNYSEYLIKRDDTMLLVVDVQERLLKAVLDKAGAGLISNIKILLETARLFDMPVIVTEQYRKGLGPTVEGLIDLVDKDSIHDKIYFNCMFDEAIKKDIESKGRNNVIITGIETHVCVFQTAMSLLDSGKNVIVVSDAVASRKKENWKFALEGMARAGAKIYPAETAAFILLEKAGTPEFKTLSPFFK